MMLFELVNDLFGSDFESDNRIYWEELIDQFGEEHVKSFVLEFKDQIDDNNFYILSTGDIQYTEDELWELRDRLCWEEITTSQEFTESGIERFTDYINWFLISSREDMIFSDEFLIKYKDLLYWPSILQKQAVSFEALKVIGRGWF